MYFSQLLKTAHLFGLANHGQVNAETALSSLPGPEGFAKTGDNQHSLGCDVITARSQGDGGTSAAYLAARLKKAGRDDLLEPAVIDSVPPVG